MDTAEYRKGEDSDQEHSESEIEEAIDPPTIPRTLAGFQNSGGTQSTNSRPISTLGASRLLDQDDENSTTGTL